jgi:basic amino acid/polyamine antiporter, APA family
MARKLPGLTRALGPSPLASVAYGEIASSLYFALGIVALYALGFTPWVLLIAGAIFLIVALSYAEGTAAIPETGGAAMLVRRAFNDPLGFMTGWALFLDYLIVIALAALFVPHYFGAAVGWDAIGDSPWDVLVGAGVIAGVAGVRLLRRPQLYRATIILAAVALVAQLLVIAFGFAYLVSTAAFGKGVDLGTAPTWSAIGFAIPVAMLAYTGLETVANLAAETREPGRNLPRGLFGGIGAVVVVSFAMGIVAISAFPAHRDPSGPGGFASELGTTWIREPLYGIARTFHAAGLPAGIADAVRVFVGISGVLVLVMAVTTAISGAGRLAYSLGQRDMLPHVFGRLNRRTLIAPVSILSAAGIAIALLVGAVLIGKPVRSLAGLYSFGVLITFTAAQIAVVKLRVSEPGLERPFRAPVNVRIRGVAIPLAALVGAPLTFAVWIVTLITHAGARIAGPIWLVAGAIVFVLVRRSRGETVMERVEVRVADFVVPHEEGAYKRILVPMKLGPIGEEVLATAIKLAEEEGAALSALHVIKVPLDQPLEAELIEEEERAAASLVEAKQLAEEHGVDVEAKVVRARSLGSAIVEEARAEGADLILMGSAPRWRRQSRFFSPTVDYVLRRAPCEVMVVAYPQGVLEEADALS